ncbi:MAG: membrane integrity-associated transporter subunit PqiC [Pararhodobacter sp.]|nr:membrane integrity-associated transporter subunit PqiC [Pararhodobacter sp.]
MTYSLPIRPILLTFCLTVLAACGTISAISGVTTPLDVFELRVPGDLPVARGRPLQRDVVIELPASGGALSTDRIMVRPTPLQAQYLADVRWSEPAPVMVQTLLLRTLDATQGLRYVGRRPLGASGDFAIVSELVDFQAVLSPDTDAATVEIRLIARIVRESDLRIIASRTFAASVPAVSSETTVLVEGFDTAVAQVLTEFAPWALAAIRAN